MDGLFDFCGVEHEFLYKLGVRIEFCGVHFQGCDKDTKNVTTVSLL